MSSDLNRHVDLPVPSRNTGKPLFLLLNERRSVRTYRNDHLALENLSQLLWAAQGVTRKHGRHLLRTAPSAGALYPVETYLLVNRVSSLSPGIYRYEAAEHRLALMRPGAWGPALARAALEQRMISDAPCTFVWSMIPSRSLGKYGERAYRYIFLDAGHIAQNVALAAVSLGLGSCQIAAFADQEVNDVLGLDGENETAIYMTSIGVSAGD